MTRKLTPLGIVALVVGCALLLAAAIFFLSCGTTQPVASPLLSVGATVRDVSNAMGRWAIFADSHPTCPTSKPAKGCLMPMERERVANALRAYDASHGGGVRVSDDPTQDNPESIRASAELVAAVADAIERAR